MKILHVNTHDLIGGAGRAAHRLSQGLRRAEYDARMLVRTRAGDDHWVKSFLPQTGISQLIYRLFVKLGDLAGFPDLYVPATRNLLRSPWMIQADIVNLHNLHGRTFSLPALKKLSHHKPVIWTLHDMWAFTGHCGYSFTCKRWQSGCGQCPQLDTPPALRRDTTRLLWHLKRNIYRASRLTLVTPSRWLAGLVRESPQLREFPVYTIPNSVDTDVFHPMPHQEARQVCGLPPDKFLLLFMSYQLDDYRKGGDVLHEALLRLGTADPPLPIEILLAGSGRMAVPDNFPFLVHHLGQIDDEGCMAAYYAAADLFVLPSRQDNLPNGLLESVACGTPVVGFDIGGVGEVVRHHETGYLVSNVNAESLAQAIHWSFQHPDDLQRWRQTCRQVALREYNLSVQARAYAALYQTTIETQPPQR